MADVTYHYKKCDITGKERLADSGEIETVDFAIGGTTYEIDLESETAGSLRFALAPYVKAARRTGGTPRMRRVMPAKAKVKGPVEQPTKRAQLTFRSESDATAAAEPTVSTPEVGRDPKAIKEWASKVGYVMSPTGKGRIPAEIEAHYWEVGGKTANVQAVGRHAATTGATLHEIKRASGE